MKRNLFFIVVLGFAFIFFIGGFLFYLGILLKSSSFRSQESVESYAQVIVEQCRPPDGQEENRRIEDTLCMQKELSNIVLRFGSAQAQTALQFLYDERYVTLGGCHSLGHTISRAAVTQRGFEEAFESLSPLCSWGYLHGLFSELHIVNNWTIDEFVKEGSRLCHSFQAIKPNFLEECLHGLGHGLADFDRNDLISPLQACDETSLALRERRWCQAGVFMELANRNSEVPPPRFYKEEDPFYPCDIIPEEYRWTCYVDVAKRAISAGISYPDVLPICGEVPDQEAQKTCKHQVYGSIAYEPYSMKAKREACHSLGEQYFRKCVKGIILTFYQNPVDFGSNAPELFCEQMETSEDADFCYSALESYR